MRRALLAAVVPIVTGIILPATALGQGENARSMPGGSFRFSIGADWQHYTDRFGAATPLNPGLVDGARQPLGFYFSADSLGVTQLEFLRPVQDSIRSLSGVGGYTLNLGRSHLTLDASVRRQPIRLAWAPSSKLGFQVTVPIVRARMSAFLRSSDTTAATRGNVGAVAAGSLTAFRAQADSALRALADQAANGPLALRTQAQNALNAIRPVVCGFSTLATASSFDSTSPCFGGQAPVPFLPLATSPAGDSITARVARAESTYTALRGQYALQSVTLPAFSAAYTLPTTPIDSTSLGTLLHDVASLGGDSLAEVVRTGIGDIEVGGWLQLLDSPGWRSQVAVTVRLPTGKMDAPGNLIDIGTGDHQMDVEVGFRNDVVVNRNLWVHAGGRYGLQMADKLIRRVTPYYLPFVPGTNEAQVNRDLGDYFAVDLVPNWQLDDAFNVGLGWHYFHQGATSYSYVDPTDGTRIGLPASVLGIGTSISQMRIGAGATFSTLNRYMQGRARVPYQVTWSYNSTFYGRGGQVPRAGVMMIQIQVYFGGLR